MASKEISEEDTIPASTSEVEIPQHASPDRWGWFRWVRSGGRDEVDKRSEVHEHVTFRKVDELDYLIG